MIKLYTQAMAFLATYKNDERGVTAIEYGLIAVAMAAMLTVAFNYTGSGDATVVDAVNSAFKKIASTISTVTGKIPAA